MENHVQHVKYSLQFRLLMMRHSRYKFKCPPVCTAFWNNTDWCNYIQGWMPEKLTAEEMFGT